MTNAILRCMEYRVHGFRHGDYLAREEYSEYWDEVESVLQSITDDDIVRRFRAKGEGKSKSISTTVNNLLKERLKELGWNAESPIFSEPHYAEGRKFRLDFAKGCVAIEVAFNHGNDAPWNLLKPTLASELNHVEKAIKTDIGVIITATDEMKAAGGFDDAVGSYEKYVDFLKPLGMLLTSPLVIVGLEAPKTFRIVHVKEGGNYRGYVSEI